MDLHYRKYYLNDSYNVLASPSSSAGEIEKEDEAETRHDKEECFGLGIGTG